MNGKYRYALSFTSQFPFCSVPLRLDAYSKCQFACRFCFAAARGGRRPAGKIQIASAERLGRLMNAAENGRGGVLAELLRAKIPVHFGGMADPFPKMEDEIGATLALLQVLVKHAYPTIISAKGVPSRVQPYIDLLSKGRMMVQFSFTVIDPSVSKKMEAGVPSEEKRFEFMRSLSNAGVPVSLRLQPVFPGHEHHAELLIRKGARAGARHVAVEFLKYPVEANWSGINRMVAAAGSSGVFSHFKAADSKLIGREWILPVGYRARAALKIKQVARSNGLTFAFADNDLLHFSDGDTCCTAADIHLKAPGLAFNFHRAIKRASPEGLISFSSIEKEWFPSGSIAQYINSHSRGRGATVQEQLVAGWNGSLYAPDSFYGVTYAGEFDSCGRKIYLLNPEVRREFCF